MYLGKGKLEKWAFALKVLEALIKKRQRPLPAVLGKFFDHERKQEVYFSHEPSQQYASKVIEDALSRAKSMKVFIDEARIEVSDREVFVISELEEETLKSSFIAISRQPFFQLKLEVIEAKRQFNEFQSNLGITGLPSELGLSRFLDLYEEVQRFSFVKLGAEIELRFRKGLHNRLVVDILDKARERFGCEFHDVTNANLEKEVVFRNRFFHLKTFPFLGVPEAFFFNRHEFEFTFDSEDIEVFLRSRIQRNIVFASESVDQFGGYYELPDLVGRSIRIRSSSGINRSDFIEDYHFHLTQLRRLIGEPIGFNHFQVYKLNTFDIENKLLARSGVLNSRAGEFIIVNTFVSDLVRVCRQLSWSRELTDSASSSVWVRFNVQPGSLFDGIYESLGSIPAVTAQFQMEDCSSLLLRAHFDSSTEVGQIKSRIREVLSRHHIPDIVLTDIGQRFGTHSYSAVYDKKGHEEFFKHWFESIRGNEVSVTTADGHLRRTNDFTVRYPKLVMNDTECLGNEGDVILVSCDYKGEQDKLKRLVSGSSIRNWKKRKHPKLMSVFFDGISDSGEDSLLQEEDFDVQFEVTEMYGRGLNEDQIDAVIRARLHPYFFLIQGPPGTGKSTVIAELAWQHMKSDFAKWFLITSETHLAVENAISKICASNRSRLRPLRIGGGSDVEGVSARLDSLMLWGEGKSADRTTLDLWLSDMLSRSRKNFTELGLDLSSLWSKVWSTNLELRRFAVEQYLVNVNIVGATSTSLGKRNSDGKFSSFFTEFAKLKLLREGTIRLTTERHDLYTSIGKVEIDFDVAVVDEASKAIAPELMIPSLYSKKVIVVGDHRQLPPQFESDSIISELSSGVIGGETISEEDEQMVKEVIAKREFFEESFFEELYGDAPDSMRARLSVQYRMHPDINHFVSKFYREDGGLTTGLNLSVGEDITHPASRGHGISMFRDKHVIWCNVDSPEMAEGTSRVNQGEVECIVDLLDQLKNDQGFARYQLLFGDSIIDSEVAVITFYGAQASRLKHAIHSKALDFPVRVSPVDRFQGMERGIVFLSLVRSNRLVNNDLSDAENWTSLSTIPQSSLGFAKSPNRFNVALSRARRLLVVVGNSKHFSNNTIYGEIISELKSGTRGSYMEYKKTEV